MPYDYHDLRPHSYLRFRAHEEARHVQVVHGHVLKDAAATAHVLHRRRRRVPGRKLNLEERQKRRRLDSHADAYIPTRTTCHGKQPPTRSVQSRFRPCGRRSAAFSAIQCSADYGCARTKVPLNIYRAIATQHCWLKIASCLLVKSKNSDLTSGDDIGLNDRVTHCVGAASAQQQHQNSREHTVRTSQRKQFGCEEPTQTHDALFSNE